MTRLCAAPNPFRSRVLQAAGAYGSKVPVPGPASEGVTGSESEASAAAALKTFFQQQEPKYTPSKVEEGKDQFRDGRDNAPDKDDAAGVDRWRRRLVYQSRYRGMVEMDLVLGAFAQEFFGAVDGLSTPPARVEDSGAGGAPTGQAKGDFKAKGSTEELHAQLLAYDAILREYDNELNKWLVELQPAPERLTKGNVVWPHLVDFVTNHKDDIVRFR